jgi:hypothetical protein
MTDPAHPPKPRHTRPRAAPTVPLPLEPIGPPSEPAKQGVAPRPWWRLGLLTGLVAVLVITAVVFVVRQDDDRTGEGTAPSAAAPEPTPVDPRPPVETQLGVFRGAEPENAREFGDWLGRDAAYVVDFSARQTWADIAQPQAQIDTWKTWPFRKVYSVALLPQDPGDTIARGANGEYNGYFADLAQRLIAAGQDDAILRLGWEFNLADSRWSTDDPAAFIKYWRHVVTTMRAQPGQHFEFDWNPNNGDTKYDAAKYYPGSDVVDYIGVDAYDVSWKPNSYPYPQNCDEACRNTRQKVAWDRAIYGGERGLRFWSDFARDQGKPLTLPEWGLWQRQDGHGGGENLNYLRWMSEFINDPANRVAYQAYFEFDGPDGPHRLMTTFPKAGELFRTLFAKPA